MKNTKYGSFELVIGVPNDYDGHRCEYARSVISAKLGEGLKEALVIQKTIPVEPIDPDENKTYYEFGGNVRLERVE